MGKGITRSFWSKGDMERFLSDYAVVWQTVWENYAVLGKESSFIQEWVNLAAINILDNPELFSPFRWMSLDKLTPEVKEEISRLLASINMPSSKWNQSN